MSHSADDKVLDEYLRGDSAFSQVYSAIDADDVPSELDRNVIAEARAAVTRRKGIAWQRVGPLFAIAATAVLTVSVVIRSGLDTSRVDKLAAEQDYSTAAEPARAPEAPAVLLPKMEMPPPASVEESRQQAEAFAPATQARIADAAPREKALEKSKSAELERVTVSGSYIRSTPEDAALPVDVITSEDLQNQGNIQARTAPSATAGPRGTVPAPAAAPPSSQSGAGVTSVDEVVVTGSLIRGSQSAAAGPRGSVAANPVSRAERKEEQSDRESSPVSWLAYIRELREERKNREADREWQRFIKAYPTYNVEAGDVARPKK